MGRSFSSVSILPRVMIGLLLAGAGIFGWWMEKNLTSNTPPLTATIWSRIAAQRQHDFIKRQHSLQSRPIREQSTQANITFSLLSSLTQSGSAHTIPPMHGTVALQQTLWINNNYGSGEIGLQGLFFIYTGSQDGSGQVASASGEVTTKSSVAQVNVDADLHMLRSGTTIRWYLDQVTLTQSGERYELPTITWGFLNEFLQTWIVQEMPRQGFTKGQVYALFTPLAQQTDQHLITTSSGTTQLIIKGEQITLDSTLDSENMLHALLTLPQQKLSWDITQESDHAYTIQLTRPKMKDIFLQGVVNFDISTHALKNEGIWSGARANLLTYSGTHDFLIRPLSNFTITPPDRTRSWNDIFSFSGTDSLTGSKE